MKRSPLQRGTSQLKRTPLNQQSGKRKAANAERKKLLRDEYGGMCEAHCVRYCSAISTDGHEVFTRGRGGSITDRRNILMVCRPCHTHITDNPEWADQHGFTVAAWAVDRFGLEAVLGEAERVRRGFHAGLPFLPFWLK